MKKLANLGIVPITMLAIMPAYAAKPIDLMLMPAKVLSSFMQPSASVQIKEINFII